jgi:hypothetical protein
MVPGADGKAVRRGALFSVPDLVQAIEAFLAAWKRESAAFRVDGSTGGDSGKD